MLPRSLPRGRSSQIAPRPRSWSVAAPWPVVQQIRRLTRMVVTYWSKLIRCFGTRDNCRREMETTHARGWVTSGSDRHPRDQVSRRTRARRARPMGYRIRAGPEGMSGEQAAAEPGRDRVFCRRPCVSTPQLTARIRAEPRASRRHEKQLSKSDRPAAPRSSILAQLGGVALDERDPRHPVIGDWKRTLDRGSHWHLGGQPDRLPRLTTGSVVPAGQPSCC